MTLSTLRIMMLAPVFYLCFTYWALSNNQIFSNVILPMKTIDDVRLSGHKLPLSLTDVRVDHSLPILCLAALLIGLVPFGSLVVSLIEAIRPGLFKVSFTVDEDLCNYFQAVD